MLYPYAREANARTRARALGLGSTITRCRLGGWYVVGPVEVDADGRRDRALYGTNRASWSIARELDTIRARGADAPAAWSARERELLALLEAPTPDELRAELRAERAAEVARSEAAIEADERAEVLEAARLTRERAARIAARSEEIAALCAELSALAARDTGGEALRELQLSLRLAELEERDADARGLRSALARVERETREAAEVEAQEREQLSSEIARLHAGSVIRLPGHEHPVVVAFVDEEARTVTVERSRGLVVYDVLTGRVVPANSQTKTEERE
jgi:hypothetical protein